MTAPSAAPTAATTAVEAQRGLSAGALFGAACLALIPLAGIPDGNGAPRLPVPVSAVVAVLCALDLLAAILLARRPLPRQASVVPAFVVAGAMLVPFAVHSRTASQAAACALFVVGTVGGAAIGVAWARDWSRFGLVDYGLVAFLTVSVVQLGVLAFASQDLSGFHRAAVLPWGASNYIAGVLVVVSFLLLARGRATGRNFGALALVGLLAALLTLSRGALIAVAAGGIVYVWGRGRTTLSRFLLRSGALVVPLLAYNAMAFVTQSRSTGGYDPSQNIDARWQLYQYAWRSFQSSPLVGTGWLAMRQNAEFSTPISYAHNVVVSFLQIGGAFGVVALGALAVAVWRSWRYAPLIRPGIVAALAISMSDPFFEGYVAALIVWAALTVVQRPPGTSAVPTLTPGATTVPGRRPRVRGASATRPEAARQAR